MSENYKEVITTAGRINKAGVIENVKILGCKSKNGRQYTMEAITKAKNLYEGAPCYLNHSKTERLVEDKFGEFNNIKVTGDGLYGDLSYLESHKMAPVVEECVNKKMNLFGMSHSCWGDAKRKDGIDVIESINKVDSIDLVSNAATTKGLFEQVENTGELIFEQVEDIDVEQVIEEVKEIIVEADKVESESELLLKSLQQEINNLKEEIIKIKEVKISKVRCEPLYENKIYPDGLQDLKKFFQE
jgi:hypothetical protein